MVGCLLTKKRNGHKGGQIEYVFNEFERPDDKTGHYYKIASKDVNIFKCAAHDYGVPQKRERIFIVGCNSKYGENPFVYPEKTHGPGRRYPYVTVEDAFRYLPEVHSGEGAEELSYKPSYEDDYENTLIKPWYEEKVRDFAEEYFPAEGIKVYTDIKSIGGSVTEENILESASAATYVFTDDSVCSAEAYERFVDACGQWLKEHCRGVPAGIYLRMTQSEAWAKISEADYEDSIREDIFTAENDCSISGSGKVTIY